MFLCSVKNSFWREIFLLMLFAIIYFVLCKSTIENKINLSSFLNIEDQYRKRNEPVEKLILSRRIKELHVTIFSTIMTIIRNTESLF